MASKDVRNRSEAGGAKVVDSALLADCRAGDRDAQRRLYELCHRRVYRLMVRMVGVQEAADVMQQVFLLLRAAVTVGWNIRRLAPSGFGNAAVSLSVYPATSRLLGANSASAAANAM